MTTNKKRVILLLVRFNNLVDDAYERWTEAADNDAAFDAGEFSGPACWRALEAEVETAARRCGFESAFLAGRATALLLPNSEKNWSPFSEVQA